MTRQTKREFMKTLATTAAGVQILDDDEEDDEQSFWEKYFGDDEDDVSEEGAVYVKQTEDELRKINPAPNEIGFTKDTGGVFHPTDEGNWKVFARLGDSPWTRTDSGALTPKEGGAVSVEYSRTKESPHTDVTAFGAVGDGSTDDTAAIKEAHEVAKSADEKLYFPNGTYLASDRIDFAVDVDAAPGATLKLDPTATLPTDLLPDSSSYEVRAFLATESAGDSRSGTTEGIEIRNLTIDWSNHDAGINRATPLWIDSAEDIRLNNVEVVNALNDDWSEDRYTFGTLVTKSSDVTIRDCWHGTAGYSAIGIYHGSEDVEVDGGVIETTQPWRHSLDTGSGNGTVSGLRVNGVTFRIDASEGQSDAVCFHGGQDQHLRDCTIVIEDAGDLDWGAKIFDDATDSSVENCTFKAEGPGAPTAVTVANTATGTEGTTVKNNTLIGDWQIGASVGSSATNCSIHYNKFGDAATEYSIADDAGASLIRQSGGQVLQGVRNYHLNAANYEGGSPDTRLDNALADASVGDVIYLENASYTSERTINKRVILEGTDSLNRGTSIEADWTLGDKAYLKQVALDGGNLIVNASELSIEKIYLWNGDITVSEDSVLISHVGGGGQSITFESDTTDGGVGVIAGDITVTDNGTNLS